MKRFFQGRQKSISLSFPMALSLSLTIFGGFYIFKSIDYGGEFDTNREKSRELLRASAQTQMANITKQILNQSTAVLAQDTTSSVKVERLRAHLDSVAKILEQIAITDRSNSLDNIFERYSTLVGIVTLMFGGLGIFTGLQFYEQSRQTREEFEHVSKAIATTVSDTKKEIDLHVEQTKDELNRTAESGSAMIWVVASALEKLINLEVIKEKELTALLNSLYLSGFRFQLYSKNEDERSSALQNIWAQGNCTDLKVLGSIWNDENESYILRNLAWRGLERIMKKCIHPDGHPELKISSVKNKSDIQEELVLSAS